VQYPPDRMVHDDEPMLISWESMAWSAPRYSRSQVDAAGEYLICPRKPFDFLSDDEVHRFGRDDVMDIINNWRASHNLPLYVIRRTLENRALRISPLSIIAQRIKRLPSIEVKLRQNQYRHLKLSKLQDIGGCRAIMPTIEDALALLKVYEKVRIGSELMRPRDYIANPKPDGYRSVHLIYKYHSDSARFAMFNNQRIEIQIRSHLQHLWATAVETVSTFSGLPLRQTSGSMLLRPKEYLIYWRRLFQLMGSAIAMREGQPIVPGTPSSREELVNELRSLDAELHVKNSLLAWTAVVSYLPKSPHAANAHLWLMKLIPEERRLEIESFREELSEVAFNEYVSAEQPKRDAPSTQVVLVSVASLDALKKAYPNYYADTKAFAQVFDEAIKR